jgi:hypothetical protein
MRDFPLFIYFLIAFLVLTAIVLSLAMVYQQWQCDAWAKINPNLDVRFFWDGFQGCMVNLDGTWINIDLVRDLLGGNVR